MFTFSYAMLISDKRNIFQGAKLDDKKMANYRPSTTCKVPWARLVQSLWQLFILFHAI